MPYLVIKDNQENILVDKAGENIYMRTYPSNYSQRTNVICKSIYDDYTVSEKNGKIQIVYKTSKNSVIYLEEDGSFFSKRILLEDNENNYNISNLKLLSDKKNYLFYLAINPYENTNDLIFHIFSNNEEKAPQALLSLPQLNSKYQCIMFEDKIYLMTCLYQEQKYELNIYIFNSELEDWEEYETLFTSDYPIIDFCFVVNNSGINIAYVIEQYGHYSLYYAKKTKKDITNQEIFSAGQKINCIIFIYNKAIWINYKINNALYYCFSINDGKSFSEVIKSTIQNNNIDNLILIAKNRGTLLGRDFFGYIGKQPYIVILSQIDVDNILFYSGENAELKKLLEVTFENNLSTERDKTLAQEISRLKEVEKEMYEKYNELVEFTKEVQAEGKKWRKKYKKVEREHRNREDKNIKIEKESDNEEVKDIIKASEINIEEN